MGLFRLNVLPEKGAFKNLSANDIKILTNNIFLQTSPSPDKLSRRIC